MLGAYDATNDRADTNDDTGNQGQGANGNIAANTGVERGITIDARTLNANNSFEYRGEEGNSNTADRFIMADANINGAAIIDGGAASNVTTVTNNRDADSVRNNDVLEVRNSATVSAGDLANISDIGTLEFTNDTAAVQNSIVVLDDTIVDRMVDAYQASRVDNLGLTTPIFQNQERLVVKAIDNLLVAGANTGLTVQADSLTGKSAVDVFLGRGTHNVVTGGGNDRVVLLGGFVAGTYNTARLGEQINAYALATAAVNTFTGTINLGGQTGQSGVGQTQDTLETFGNINLAGATLTGIEAMTANSDVTLNESHLSNTTAAGTAGTNILGGLTFANPPATAHSLTIVNDANVNLTVDLAKVTSAGAITLTLNGVTTTGAIQGGGQVTIGGATANADNLTGTAGNDIIDGLAGNDVINGLAGADTITGGTGADQLTGGLGADQFGSTNNFAAFGQGVASTAAVFAGVNVAAADTITFGNGVDRVIDFSNAQGDKLDVVTAANAGTAIVGAAANTDLAAGTTYVAYGSFNALTNVFTFAANFDAVNASAAYVVVGDAGVDTITNSTGGVVLTGLAQALVAADFV